MWLLGGILVVIFYGVLAIIGIIIVVVVGQSIIENRKYKKLSIDEKIKHWEEEIKEENEIELKIFRKLEKMTDLSLKEIEDLRNDSLEKLNEEMDVQLVGTRYLNDEYEDDKIMMKLADSKRRKCLKKIKKLKEKE